MNAERRANSLLRISKLQIFRAYLSLNITETTVKLLSKYTKLFPGWYLSARVYSLKHLTKDWSINSTSVANQIANIFNCQRRTTEELIKWNALQKPTVYANSSIILDIFDTDTTCIPSALLTVFALWRVVSVLAFFEPSFAVTSRALLVLQLLLRHQ